MSWRKTRFCITCRKTEDHVRIMICPNCKVATYCSKLCRKGHETKDETICTGFVHLSKYVKEDHAMRFELLATFGQTYGHYQALEMATNWLLREFEREAEKAWPLLIRRTGELIAFLIQLGRILKKKVCFITKWHNLLKPAQTYPNLPRLTQAFLDLPRLT